MKNIEIYQVYFTNSRDNSENNEWYYTTEEKADKKYRQLCKKYWLKPSFCFTDRNWYCIGYSQIHIEN